MFSYDCIMIAELKPKPYSRPGAIPKTKTVLLPRDTGQQDGCQIGSYLSSATNGSKAMIRARLIAEVSLR